MNTHTYTIIVHPADPDETGYWVEVPALPGCVTQGETYEQAVAMAQEAIEGYLESLRKHGEPIPVEAQPASDVVAAIRVRTREAV